MKIKIICIFLIVFACYSFSFGQSWLEMMGDTNANLYTIQTSFNKYWEGKNTKKVKGWKQFKRWENFMAPRVYPSGDLNHAEDLWNAYEEYKNKYPIQKLTNNGWTCMGAVNTPINGGAGRLNCLAFHPDDPNIIFVGAPAGGLWKTTDGGSNWTTNTDLLPNLGVSDIAINPKNPNIMYIATGDRDAWDTYTVGILKSTDGGQTWNPSGIAWDVLQNRKVSRILINPEHPDTIFAATTLGIYSTFNGGDNWSLIKSGNFRDLEFKPGDPSVIWASAPSRIWKSINGGAHFSIVSTFTPSALGRINIAVTESDPNYLYVLGSNNSDYGFAGVWRTTDLGNTFTLCTNSPNMLGWSTDGSDSGGQGWYDLSIAVSPTDKNTVFIGGVNIWKSTNGGTQWDMSAHWYGGDGHPYVHADVHFLKFLPGSGNTLFAACDGGLFKTTNNGTAWSDKSNGLGIGQMYRLGCSSLNNKLIMTGWQDNGSNLCNAPTWINVLGGDGMECLIDYTNIDIMYGSIYYGQFYRTETGANDWVSIKNNITESGAWISPFVQDPVNSQTLFIGLMNLWKSTDRGDNWIKLSDFTDSTLIDFISVATSNPNYIYIHRNGYVLKSIDGGITWVNIDAGLPPGVWVSSIAVSPDDPDVLWVSLSGYFTGEKVYASRDGGTTWINYSGTLPNIPANTIIMESGTDEGLYVGTDLGVFYRDSTMDDWDAFNHNLPNVVIDEMEIQYASGKLRAATYGRGLWESDLYHLVNIDKENINNQSLIKIFPNPGNGIINIYLDDETNKYDQVSLRVFNSAGRMVYNMKSKLTGDCCITADLSNEANGFYFVKIKTEKRNYSGTFVKE